MSFDVSPAFALAAALIYLLDGQGIFALAVISAAVHELGHYAALCAFGAKPYLLRLELTGAAMYFDETRLSYARELIAALAGPLAGLLLAFAAAFWGAHALAGVSLLLSVFNLLPIGGLDGGRVLSALLSLFLEHERAQRTCFWFTTICAAAMLVAGVYFMLRTRSGGALILAGGVLLANNGFLHKYCLIK
ncbi:MAG: site-2 protease family protein [Oscillospiraceae bacterium]|nr:site-2 protease family protein [Oscillospiraceae bacterium]